jgi:HSP20 family protein
MITLFKDPFFQGLETAFETNRFMRTPETKISKTETEYRIDMAVPGLNKEDLKIITKEGVLKISFNRDEKEDESYFTSSFTKSYNIPDDVKEKDIEGKVDNGVLILTLPIDRKKSIERSISLN